MPALARADTGTKKTVGSLQHQPMERRQEIGRLGGLASQRSGRNIITTELVRLLQTKWRKGQKTGKQLLAEVVFEKAIAGDMQAVNLIFDRTEGKAVQPVEVADVGMGFASAAIMALGTLMQAIAGSQHADIIDGSATIVADNLPTHSPSEHEPALLGIEAHDVADSSDN